MPLLGPIFQCNVIVKIKNIINLETELVWLNYLKKNKSWRIFVSNRSLEDDKTFVLWPDIKFIYQVYLSSNDLILINNARIGKSEFYFSSLNEKRIK